MKIKNILVFAMAAIMAFAGGAFANGGANVTTGTTNTQTGLGGLGFVGTPLVLGCQTNAGGAGTGTCLNNANDAAFTTDAQTGSGTGLGLAGMPAQVTYSAITNQYTGGVGPQTGYDLDKDLFGHCAGGGANAQVCPKFVPANGDVNGAVAAIEATMPLNVDNFNQGTFSAGLVTGMQDDAGSSVSALSIMTTHHALTAIGADGDFFDQRLATSVSIDGTNAGQHMNSTVIMGQGTNAGSMNNFIDPGPPVATMIDPLWLTNADLGNAAVGIYGGDGANSAVIGQAVTDAMAGANPLMDNGSYGQAFTTHDTAGTPSNAVAPANPASSYNVDNVAMVGIGPAGPLAIP